MRLWLEHSPTLARLLRTGKVAEAVRLATEIRAQEQGNREVSYAEWDWRNGPPSGLEREVRAQLELSYDDLDLPPKNRFETGVVLAVYRLLPVTPRYLAEALYEAWGLELWRDPVPCPRMWEELEALRVWSGAPEIIGDNWDFAWLYASLKLNEVDRALELENILREGEKWLADWVPETARPRGVRIIKSSRIPMSVPCNLEKDTFGWHELEQLPKLPCGMGCACRYGTWESERFERALR